MFEQCLGCYAGWCFAEITSCWCSLCGPLALHLKKQLYSDLALFGREKSRSGRVISWSKAEIVPKTESSPNSRLGSSCMWLLTSAVPSAALEVALFGWPRKQNISVCSSWGQLQTDHGPWSPKSWSQSGTAISVAGTRTMCLFICTRTPAVRQLSLNKCNFSKHENMRIRLCHRLLLFAFDGSTWENPSWR